MVYSNLSAYACVNPRKVFPPNTAQCRLSTRASLSLSSRAPAFPPGPSYSPRSHSQNVHSSTRCHFHWSAHQRWTRTSHRRACCASGEAAVAGIRPSCAAVDGDSGVNCGRSERRLRARTSWVMRRRDARSSARGKVDNGGPRCMFSLSTPKLRQGLGQRGLATDLTGVTISSYAGILDTS